MVGIMRALWWIFELRLKSRERIEAESLMVRRDHETVAKSGIIGYVSFLKSSSAAEFLAFSTAAG
jgi:hypothetical protein